MTFLVLSVLPAPDSPLRTWVTGRPIGRGNDVRDEDTLVLSLFSHIDPCTLGDGEDMGRILIATLASILVNDGIRVEG